MKLQLIIVIIALSVTIASTLVWPWESLVCSVQSNCSGPASCPSHITNCYTEGNNTFLILSTYNIIKLPILLVLKGDDGFNITLQEDCTCGSCNVTISPNQTNCPALPPFNLVLNHHYNNNTDSDNWPNCSVSNSHSEVCMLITHHNCLHRVRMYVWATAPHY